MVSYNFIKKYLSENFIKIHVKVHMEKVFLNRNLLLNFNNVIHPRFLY